MSFKMSKLLCHKSIIFKKCWVLPYKLYFHPQLAICSQTTGINNNTIVEIIPGIWLPCNHNKYGNSNHTYRLNVNLKVIIKQAIKNAPPMGDPKQLDTPTAQAAASISVFLDSFCKTQTNKQTNPELLINNGLHKKEAITNNSFTLNFSLPPSHY